MKVLHLSSERTWRGGEQQLAYLLEESKKHGIETFVASKKGSAFSEYCRKNNQPFVEVGFKNELDVFTAIKIKNICKEQSIDFVHIHSSHSHAMAVQSVMFGNKIPLVLSRKVDFPIKNNVFSKWKFNHSSIKKIICVSNAIKQIILPDLKNKNLCEVVYDGIDLDRFHYQKGKNVLRDEFGVAKNKTIVANISAIAPHKHYFTFVDTAEKVLRENPDFHFFIIGDGPLRNEIEVYIKKKKLTQEITFTGFRKDIPDIFPDIDLFLMTSETEGLGSTLLDAAAHKTPIVSTNAGGIPEVIQHRTSGLLADVYDSNTLAKFVLELSTDKSLQEQLTEANYKNLTSRFTKEIMAQQTFKIYEQINN